jgi:T5SS/PEP-CTERM-associated repeat protein
MSSIVGADRARSSSARTRLNDGRLAALLVSTALTAPLALGVSQGWAQVAASGDVSPSPAVSPVWTTPSLLVGNTGSGSVTITAGGQVSSDMGNIGSAAGSSGRVSVDGDGTTWTNTDLLIVGDEGDGTLSVTSGALVSSSSIYMAAREDASGAVTVDAGRLSLAGLLTVGLEGRAAVTILNGGEVSTNSAWSAAASVQPARRPWTAPVRAGPRPAISSLAIRGSAG